MNSVEIPEQTRRELEAFVYCEAQLADESRYDEWEALLAKEMRYWVPVNGNLANPDKDVSIINDNRSRLATRLRQLRTGTRLGQSPPSVMRRMLTNLVYEEQDGAYMVSANFVVHEYQLQSVGELTLWPGRVEYRLVREEGMLRMSQKKVMLVNAGGPIPSLAFLI